MPLSTRHKKHLRGLTHALQPVVMIADKGLTDNVMAELESALEHHELIKVKLRCDRETRAALIDEIAHRCAAEKVHVIGQIACFFRRNPKKPVVELPK
jgi:RNA-binding protein